MSQVVRVRIAMQGAIEVVQGVFMGGYEEARGGIKTGTKDASQFRSALSITA